MVRARQGWLMRFACERGCVDFFVVKHLLVWLSDPIMALPMKARGFESRRSRGAAGVTRSQRPDLCGKV